MNTWVFMQKTSQTSYFSCSSIGYHNCACLQAVFTRELKHEAQSIRMQQAEQEPTGRSRK